MTPYLLALKNTLRSQSFVLLLLLCVAGIFLIGRSDLADRKPPAGVCDQSDSEQGTRITSCLAENGFLPFDDPEEMREMVARGELDCALILPHDLAERLRSGELEGAVPFVSAPSSYMPHMYRNLAAAALFSERAPYITADALRDTGITEDAVIEKYFSYYEDGYAFAFDVVTESGVAVPENTKARSLTLGALSVILFVLVFSSVWDALGGSFHSLCRRIGFLQSVRSFLLPSAAVRVLLIAIPILLSLWIAGQWAEANYCLALIPATLIYTILLVGLALLVSFLLPKREHMLVLFPFLGAATLAVCPVFSDASILSPVLAAVRAVLPTYWLWQIGAHPIRWLIFSIALFILASAALVVRYCVLLKYSVGRWGK